MQWWSRVGPEFLSDFVLRRWRVPIRAILCESLKFCCCALPLDPQWYVSVLIWHAGTAPETCDSGHGLPCTGNFRGSDAVVDRASQRRSSDVLVDSVRKGRGSDTGVDRACCFN